LFAGRETLTVQDILDLNISADDKLWAVLREDMLDAAILHEFACRCAEEALKPIDNPDPRSIAAIATKRAWLRGEITDDELSAAWATAITASNDVVATAWAVYAASYAARSDAADAAVTAARTDAYAAAAAAASACNTASWVAAHAAARDKQIEILKEIM